MPTPTRTPVTIPSQSRTAHQTDVYRTTATYVLHLESRLHLATVGLDSAPYRALDGLTVMAPTTRTAGALVDALRAIYATPAGWRVDASGYVQAGPLLVGRFVRDDSMDLVEALH